MSDIEDLLRRYRPVGPPPELDARIFGHDGVQRIWPWAAAAAALLAFTVGVHAAGHRLVASEPPVADPLGPVIDHWTAQLGGGAEARERAELLVLEQQARAALQPPPPDQALPDGAVQ